MHGHGLLDLSVVELARRIRRRDVSPVELVEAHIARTEAVNPTLNALIADRFSAARSEARQAEAQLMASTAPDELPPLLGIPCSIKEFIGVAGMPQTAGLVKRRAMLAPEDAALVQRLRRAGAIVLGVTNVPEGGLWMETFNRVFGRTHNPWNGAHTPGGSSGGEAALIAAGGAAFGMGSDVGGSIRIPAAFCGVVGHKPSGRLVPNTGHFPAAHGEMGAYMVCGPITRRVEDLMPLLRIIAGPDGVDPVARPFQLGDPQAVDLRDVVVYPVETHGRAGVQPTMRRAVRQAARALADRGARVAELSAPLGRHSFSFWSAILGEVPGLSYAHLLGDGEPLPLAWELAKLVVGRSSFTAPALTMAALEAVGRRLPRSSLAKMAEAGRRVRDALEAELGPNGVILHPPYTRPAPRHNYPLLTPFDFVCTGLFNVFEFPVTQVPTGFDEHGLPVGVQVAARRGQDHLTIAVAQAIEAETGGWVRAEPRNGHTAGQRPVGIATARAHPN